MAESGSDQFELDGNTYRFSRVVKEVVTQLRYGPPVSAWEITERLIKRHIDYGGGMGARFVAQARSFGSPEKHTVAEWMQYVLSLYDERKIGKLYTRVVILGLCIWDRMLGKDLNKNGFLDALVEELKQRSGSSYDRLLSPHGLESWKSREWALKATTAESKDTPHVSPEASPKQTQQAETEEELLPGLEGLVLSESVKAVAKRLSPLEVKLGDIVQELLREHDHYAGGKAKQIKDEDLGIIEIRLQRVRDWLYEVNSLFNHKIVPVIEGKHVILGLSLLRPDLKARLVASGFLDALEDELEQPLSSLLSQKGLEMLASPASLRRGPGYPPHG